MITKTELIDYIKNIKNIKNIKHFQVYFFSIRFVRYVCYILSFIMCMLYNAYFFYKCRFCLKDDVKCFSYEINCKNNNTDMNYNRGKIISWNIHYGYGLNESFNLSKMSELLEKENAEVYILQEVIKNEFINQEIYLKNRLNIKHSYYVPDIKVCNVYQGNLILTRNPIIECKKYKLNQWYGHNNNNIIGIKTKLNNKLTWIFNVHLESDLTLYQQESQLKELNILIQELKSKNKDEELNFIVGGDFNIPQWSDLIHKNINDLSICNNKKLTFPVYKPILKLDYFVTDYNNYTFDVIESQLSDHKPISLIVN